MQIKVAQAAILAMEILLLPTGLISTLLILKDSTNNNPFGFLHSLFCNLRDLRLSFLSSPFFICLFINSIVLLILLSSSKFHHRKTQPYHHYLFSYDAATDIPAVNAPPPPLSPAGTLPFDTMGGGGVDVKEHQNPEINEEEEDTIEATWEAISGGGGGEEKQSSKLKKCETWPRPPPTTGQDTTAPEPLRPSAAAATSWKELRKSVTFNDAVSACRRGGLARDLLRSPEEMNKRFDDFIRKVNHELRLQRQESEQRFLETINRGLY
ncbi:PREDICTED: uncharacterized protein LOC109193643 isoform X2 [Ipomoea nil]|uniref:uncharacterized protein LOC109193643 isoform X2 n=1 Tax=Ipomoea nil TaxID=35883 RepID=UPI0009015BA9|nr:PREDICTED: uncharacterized protein LOC109193643 isoform X2 [Ipomoea nil]